MKRYLVFICCLLLWQVHAQEQKKYTFLLYLGHYSEAPKFKKMGEYLEYAGANTKEKQFFSRYAILGFNQAFPDSRWEKTLSVFIVRTYDKPFMQDILDAFPDKYYRVEDITDEKIENNLYPNDYGTTSPVTNLGSVASRKDLDYIDAPGAWNITTGSSDIIVGISDTNIDITDPDLSKTVRLPYMVSQYPNPSSYNRSNDGTWHGTAVAEIAAGTGNNGWGSTGVCPDCGIVANRSEYGTLSNQNAANFNLLLQLAKAGAKVINMSWRYMTNNPNSAYFANEWVINEIVDCYGVIMVGGSGNENCFKSAGMYYNTPAYFDKVISVSSVAHSYTFPNPVAFYGTTPTMELYQYIEDAVSIDVNGTDINNPVAVSHNGWAYSWQHTLNDKVDILAPGYNVYIHPWYTHNESEIYGNGTSEATPMVSGTIGLMLSVDNCLRYLEVEDILQLTSKDVEHLAMNEAFYGYVGSGKLETGKSVQFVNEMIKVNGNATISDHIFYRFDFKLARINNKLTVDNVTFKERCTADFTARKIIDVVSGDFNPDENGFVDLKIDADLDMCIPFSVATECDSSDEGRRGLFEEEKIHVPPRLYPNPNNGTFEITLGGAVTGDVNVEVVDIYGKTIYRSATEELTFAVDIPNLSTGVYFVRLTGGVNESIKFIKE
jgi:hypothetical protein